VTLRVHLLELAGVDVVRNNVADPFRVVDGGLRPRVPTADYVLVDRLSDADVAALPAHWASYRGADRDRALARIDEAAASGRPTVVWAVGDHEVRLDHPGVILFQLAASASRRRGVAAVHTYPVFIDDLAAVTAVPLRPGPAQQDRPLVGFCGQGAERPAERVRRVASRLRPLPGHHREPWSSHVALRAAVLRALQADPGVDTDFVVRDRYRNGLRDPDARRDPSEPSTKEFHDDVLRTDYTVCVRGGGNFSVRLYEVLCLGRIPLIVDTGGLLPWRDVLPWHELAVVADGADVDAIPALLRGRHGRLDPEHLRAWQAECRQTWEEWLSLEGFFTRFSRHFR